MRITPLGDSALIVELGGAVDEPTHHRVQAAFRLLSVPPLPGVTDVVPAFTTVTLFYDLCALTRRGDPAENALEQLTGLVRSRLRAVPPVATAPPGPVIEIPVCYGGASGPDLELVANHTGLTPAEVIWRHSNVVYFVHMIGFSPGFPYLGGLPECLAMPRRSTARTSVAPGSVGIANRQSCIYPLATPGGWNLIGRTPVKLFRIDANPPGLLHPGDRVQFRAIPPEEFEERRTTG